MKTRRILKAVGPAILAAGLCLTASAFADDLPTITIGASPQVENAIAGAAKKAKAE